MLVTDWRFILKNKIVKGLLILSAVCGLLAIKPTDIYAKDIIKVEKGTILYNGNDFLAIRKSPNTSSEMIGKLLPNSGAIKTGKVQGDWIEVVSGEIQGWVYEKSTITDEKLQEYVLDNLNDFDIDVVTKRITGQYKTKKDLKEDNLNYTEKGILQSDNVKLYKTESLTDKRQDKKAKKDYVRIIEDGTRIRSNNSRTDSLVYSLENCNTDFEYIDETENWYKIKYNDKEAYVSKDCAKKIVKEVELNNIANVDYIVNAMYNVEQEENGITKITIKGTDYYVSTDDVYFLYLKDNECTATNIVGKEAIYDLNNIGKKVYCVDITNPSSDTTVQMFMPKEDCILEASFEEAEEIDENNSDNTNNDLSNIDDKTKSKYKDKYNYEWDNSSTEQRNDIINYACTFLGNPYRYGGTSLTNGIDCSAYVMRIYQHFGIQIARDSNSQYKESRGKKIDAEDIQPGDLIYYSHDGGQTTYHVVMYLGDGKCINASCRKFGVCISNINYDNICAIKNYID